MSLIQLFLDQQSRRLITFPASFGGCVRCGGYKVRLVKSMLNRATERQTSKPSGSWDNKEESGETVVSWVSRVLQIISSSINRILSPWVLQISQFTEHANLFLWFCQHATQNGLLMVVAKLSENTFSCLHHDSDHSCLGACLSSGPSLTTSALAAVSWHQWQWPQSQPQSNTNMEDKYRSYQRSSPSSPFRRPR